MRIAEKNMNKIGGAPPPPKAWKTASVLLSNVFVRLKLNALIVYLHAYSDTPRCRTSSTTRMISGPQLELDFERLGTM